MFRLLLLSLVCVRRLALSLPNSLPDAPPLTICSHCNTCETVPHTKFVIYSYNFGNFRNELAGIESWMAALTHFGIDAYFFTDDPDFNPQLDSWTIVYVPTREEENGIPGTRLSGKDIKFKGHPLLDPYDYHIYVDAAHLRMHKMSSGSQAACCTMSFNIPRKDCLSLGIRKGIPSSRKWTAFVSFSVPSTQKSR